MGIKTIIFLTLIFLSGCTTAIEYPKESGEISVYFCPKDDCANKLVELIKNSSEKVYCALFDIGLTQLIGALADKSHSADVKIVIDNVNFEGQINGTGVRFDTNSQLTHNKFCIFDDDKLFTGSFNPTERGAYKNNNNMLVIESKYLVENYNGEFDELWDYMFGKGERVKNPIIYLNNKKIENYFCPEDCVSQVSSTNKGNAIYKIIYLINNAEHSIYFMTFSFTSEDIANPIINQYGKGLDIKGIFEKFQSGSKYSQYKRMKDFGLDVRLDSNPAFLHHKVFIIDNKTVVTGSWNPTQSGTTKNDENILIIHDKDIAQKYLEEFTRLWNDFS